MANERTLAIVKPDAVSRSLTGEILKRIEASGLRICALKLMRLTRAQAEQFYQALKLLNIDAVLVRVPEEPHGISRRPSHHVAKMLYVAGWFDEHRAK